MHISTAKLVAARWLIAVLLPAGLAAQEYGRPDREAPADSEIQAYLARLAAALHAGVPADSSPEPGNETAWRARRDEYRQEYLDMLGLWPLPEKTPLQATTTGSLEREDYIVEKLHFQSRPGLYVTANLYRPKLPTTTRLPTVLYVCGHSPRGRSGNKTAYQSHGIWFARHGYVCLLLDTLQLGEIAAIHHGTYREERWWWHSRGYTPAGVECWNGIRALDYLTSREDVDPQRIAVTGISGGGAATFWIAAADERVRVAVPVSGMADLPSYVMNRVVNGHCDCMFLYNTYQWPWARIAQLIAPRPFLFVNSDRDPIFPMDANERLSNNLERFYSKYGASEMFDTVVSVGGHAYRKDIRQAVFRFIQMHLQGDPSIVADSEVDLVEGQRHPIPPEALRVFPTGEDLPADELNTTIDRHFVPLARPTPPEGSFTEWRSELLEALRTRTSLRNLPEPAAPPIEPLGDDHWLLQPDAGVMTRLRRVKTSNKGEAVENTVALWVSLAKDEGESGAARAPQWLGDTRFSGTKALYHFQPRGAANRPWTRRNPPNYVERAHVLLGTTVDGGRLADIQAAVKAVRQMHGPGDRLRLVGSGAAAVLVAYAALLGADAGERTVDEVVLHRPQWTHARADAPQFISVLRVCDVPTIVGLLAPRRLAVLGSEKDTDARKRVEGIYRAASAERNLDWQ